MAKRRYLILTTLVASLLAGGCCCQPLSGRYCDVACCPPRCTARCCCPLCIAPVCMSMCQSATAQCPPPVCPPATEQCPPPACSPAGGPSLTAADSTSCPDSCQSFPRCEGVHAWFAGLWHGVPSQQHPDYYSPPAKFHPIPTRPAFEPLSSYPPLLPADPGMNNPLRASTDRAGQPTVR